MSEWGLLDMPAALDWLARRFRGLPLRHASGTASAGSSSAACTTRPRPARTSWSPPRPATGARQRLPFRYLALLFWKLYGPLELWRRGYVPRGALWRGAAAAARRVPASGAGGASAPRTSRRTSMRDLRAARSPRCAHRCSRWPSATIPIATPRGGRGAALAPIRTRRSSGAGSRRREAGVRRIGHHGFFAERHRESLWRAALDWIDARCAYDGLGGGAAAAAAAARCARRARGRCASSTMTPPRSCTGASRSSSSSQAYTVAAITCSRVPPRRRSRAGAPARTRSGSARATCADSAQPTSTSQPRAVSGSNFCVERQRQQQQAEDQRAGEHDAARAVAGAQTRHGENVGGVEARGAESQARRRPSARPPPAELRAQDQQHARRRRAASPAESRAADARPKRPGKNADDASARSWPRASKRRPR